MALSDLYANRTHAVFDAYGTLFDVHAAVERHAGRIGPDAAALSEMWRAKQLEYSWILSLCGRYESFWTLTERALDYALARHPDVDPSVRPALLDAYGDLAAYPEVPGVLRALRAGGLRTAIFSNGNPAMLDRAVAAAGLADCVDAVISVDAVGIFKTAPATYQSVLDRLGTDRDGLVFHSSNRWDVAGASAFGLAPVWVNRRGLPDEYPHLPPVRVVASLDALV